MDSWEAMAAVSQAVWREPARKDDADTQKEAEAEQQRRLEAGRHSCSPAAPLPFLRPGSVSQEVPSFPSPLQIGFCHLQPQDC